MCVFVRARARVCVCVCVCVFVCVCVCVLLLLLLFWVEEKGPVRMFNKDKSKIFKEHSA